MIEDLRCSSAFHRLLSNPLVSTRVCITSWTWWSDEPAEFVEILWASRTRMSEGSPSRNDEQEGRDGPRGGEGAKGHRARLFSQLARAAGSGELICQSGELKGQPLYLALLRPIVDAFIDSQLLRVSLNWWPEIGPLPLTWGDQCLTWPNWYEMVGVKKGCIGGGPYGGGYVSVKDENGEESSAHSIKMIVRKLLCAEFPRAFTFAMKHAELCTIHVSSAKLQPQQLLGSHRRAGIVQTFAATLVANENECLLQIIKTLAAYYRQHHEAIADRVRNRLTGAHGDQVSFVLGEPAGDAATKKRARGFFDELFGLAEDVTQITDARTMTPWTQARIAKLQVSVGAFLEKVESNPNSRRMIDKSEMASEASEKLRAFKARARTSALLCNHPAEENAAGTVLASLAGHAQHIALSGTAPVNDNH